jgi:hypothetical protein
MKMADPSAVARPGHEVDEAFENLCKNRFELDPSAVKSELARIRIKCSASGRDQKALCKRNLLRYYHELEVDGRLDDFPSAKRFVMCALSTPVTTVKVESLFSVMKLQ